MFKLKKQGQGKFVKHKAKLAIKEFLQKKEINFDENFSLLVKITSTRIGSQLAFGTQTNKCEGNLSPRDRKIYMEQPKGFEALEKYHFICMLKQSHYDLKQAPKQ